MAAAHGPRHHGIGLMVGGNSAFMQVVDAALAKAVTNLISRVIRIIYMRAVTTFGDGQVFINRTCSPLRRF